MCGLFTAIDIDSSVHNHGVVKKCLSDVAFDLNVIEKGNLGHRTLLAKGRFGIMTER